MTKFKDMSIEERCAERAKYWTGDVGPNDDFGNPIEDEFIDGVTHALSEGRGKWAIMSRKSFLLYGVDVGTGRGQRYKKQRSGRWLKVEG